MIYVLVGGLLEFRVDLCLGLPIWNSIFILEPVSITFPSFPFLVCLHFFRLSQKDRREGKQSKKARAGKALLKTTVAFVKLMGIKFRGGGGAADGRSSGSPQGLSASAPALGAATKIHAH